jgi:multiple sugar transport system permease protein
MTTDSAAYKPASKSARSFAALRMAGTRRRRSAEMKNLPKGLFFISPWIFGFLLFTVTPVLLSLYWSFCRYSLLKPAVFHGLANYRQMVHDGDFWKSLGVTLYYASMALPASMIVSLGLALLLNQKIKGQGIYRTLIFLPSLVPIVASALLWMWIFNSRYGLLNEMLAKIGISGPGWLTDARWAMPSLALMSLWSTGHTVIIYLAGLQDVPTELYESAEIDGANSWHRLWHVTIPMITPVIFFNLIMAIIGTFNVFAMPYMMTAGGPAHSTYFYAMYLFDNAFVFLKMGYACALAWIQLIIVLVLTIFAFMTARRWVHYQGRV